MKIIDNKKDFYDFLVGKYWIDEKIIFDRRNSFPVKPKIIFDLTSFSEEIYYRNKNFKNFLIHYILIIWDEIIHIFLWKDWEIFNHFDIEKIFFDKLKNKDYIFKNWKKYEIFTNFASLVGNFWEKYFDLKSFQKLERKDFIKNIKNSEFLEEIPIIFIQSLLERRFYRGNFIEATKIIFKNPNLQNLWIFLDPEFVWQSIYNFLLNLKTKKETFHEAKNDEKIYNKWFDLKKSFRPKMKNKK